MGDKRTPRPRYTVTIKSTRQRGTNQPAQPELEHQEEGWWADRWVWYNLITHFHETAHVAHAQFLPAKTPLWILEGSASYTAHRVDRELSRKYRKLHIAEDNYIAMFLAADPALVWGLFSQRTDRKLVEESIGPLRAYKLFLGGFLAADRLGKPLLPRITAIGPSENRRRRVQMLRAIDALELQHEAKALRDVLVEESTATLADRGADKSLTPFATLGWLGACDRAPRTPDVQGCGDELVDLVPFFARCLDRQRLESMMIRFVECGGRIPPGWGDLVEEYCERFPDAAAAFLGNSSLATAAETRTIVARCVTKTNRSGTRGE